MSLEPLSWRSRHLLTGDKRSWCAYAYDNRQRRFWRVWVAVWDRVFWWERGHCLSAWAHWRAAEKPSQIPKRHPETGFPVK